MRLLIITQKVDKNDSILGFFHAWVVEFAAHLDSLLVVCLEEGEHNLPSHVKVVSLGKEKGVSKIGILKNLFTALLRERTSYDTVLVHMNPIYVVIAGWYWRITPSKKAYLWYTHKHVDWKLWIAEKFVTKVFTASKESFRLKSKKVVVMGHGIDTSLFKSDPAQKRSTSLELLSVGRISKSKRLDFIVAGLRKLHDTGVHASLTIVGSPITADDEKEYALLKEQIERDQLSKYVSFVGSITNTESVVFYQKADIFVHASETGSLDKVVLEAMACGLPVVSSNDAAVSLLGPISKGLIFEKGNVEEFTQKIMQLVQVETSLRDKLRGEVVDNHNLGQLISGLIERIEYD